MPSISLHSPTFLPSLIFFAFVPLPLFRTHSLLRRTCTRSSCSSHMGQWLLRAGAVDMRSAVDRWITARLNSLETKYEWDAFLTVQNKTYPCHECCEGMQPAEPAGSGAL